MYCGSCKNDQIEVQNGYYRFWNSVFLQTFADKKIGLLFVNIIKNACHRALENQMRHLLTVRFKKLFN
jgi:hypothetical protein